MLRSVSKGLLKSGISHRGALKVIHSRNKSTATTPPTPEDIAACREWLSKFTLDTIPKRLCELSFSRSSGPGGQNVNKVSTKATLRLPVSQITPLLPALLHAPIRQSRYYAAKSDAIVIQADDSRKQADNAQHCFIRLHNIVTEAGVKVLPGETSEGQKKHVQKLQKRENEHRLKTKKMHAGKKAGRRGGGDD